MSAMSSPTPAIRQRLADNMRRLRQQREWSQEELAAYSGIHHTQISRIERMQNSVGIDMIEKLAMAFGVSVGELLD
ncbi:transcriptional regulator with XRE-family HTH domain [Deinococcus metalli]|uniref:Transcriptional regulator with XRE-family HTH domain n=2 Tax=Deinococcus metalli TaxID=1141878 RepID=A0A7W8KIL0_9DEIO|nr:helix-turn-helix transcriptional regulator [Deinococcus metalli]MBB5378555.1 transcriptional regulator with XRE-family HTH domain [Deinococcus metalli]